MAEVVLDSALNIQTDHNRLNTEHDMWEPCQLALIIEKHPTKIMKNQRIPHSLNDDTQRRTLKNLWNAVFFLYNLQENIYEQRA